MSKIWTDLEIRQKLVESGEKEPVPLSLIRGWFAILNGIPHPESPEDSAVVRIYREHLKHRTSLCLIAGLIAAALTTHAAAAELELKDLPAVIKTLRECKTATSMFSGTMTSCRLKDDDVWASVHSDDVTIYFSDDGSHIRPGGVWGSGKTVQAAVSDLAKNLSEMRAGAKSTLDAMAPLLPTQ
jgi:hypothetical protein